jgi:hypothetical protein
METSPSGLRVNELSKFTELRAWYEVGSQCASHVCGVCLSPFQGLDIVRVLFACSHALHSRCGDEWLCDRGTCAQCGIAVNEIVTADQTASPIASPSCCNTPVPRPFRGSSPNSDYSSLSSSVATPIPTSPPNVFDHLIRNQCNRIGDISNNLSPDLHSDSGLASTLLSMQGQLSTLQQQAQSLMTQLQSVTMLVMQNDVKSRSPSDSFDRTRAGSSRINRSSSSINASSSFDRTTPPLAHPVPTRNNFTPDRPLILAGFAGTPCFGKERKITSPKTVMKISFPSSPKHS